MGKEYLDITAEDFVLAKTDDEVFNKIYKANEKLVYFCMQKCANMNIPEDELYNSLVDGLIKAINCYDPNRSMSFAAFAVPCMMNNAKKLRIRCSSSKDVLRRIEQYDSMEKVILNSKDGKDITVKDVVSDQSYEDYCENELKETINTNRLLSFLSDRDSEILKMYFSGTGQVEVAKTIGLS